MRHKIVMTLCVAAAMLGLLSGCARESAEPPAPAAEPAPSATVTAAPVLADLNGTQWKLVSFTASDAVPADVTVTFSVQDNQVSGTSGCNRYTGSIAEVEPGRITIGPLAGTRMACPPPQQDVEDRYLKALQQVSGWSLADGVLTLAYQQDDTEQFLSYEPDIASQSTD